jgi:hypothetical protein
MKVLCIFGKAIWHLNWTALKAFLDNAHERQYSRGDFVTIKECFAEKRVSNELI